MSFQCPITIQFTPRGGAAVTLVAAGGWLSELPQFNATQQVFETEGLSLAEAFFKPIGGATVRFSLAIETDEMNRLAAQNDLRTCALQGSGELSFIADGWRCDFAKAVVSEITPDLPSGHPNHVLIRTLQITCGVPTYTLTP